MVPFSYICRNISNQTPPKLYLLSGKCRLLLHADSTVFLCDRVLLFTTFYSGGDKYWLTHWRNQLLDESVAYIEHCILRRMSFLTLPTPALDVKLSSTPTPSQNKVMERETQARIDTHFCRMPLLLDCYHFEYVFSTSISMSCLQT